MALPKNKSRLISVDNEDFRYVISISWQGSGNYHFNVTVQHEEMNGSKLLLQGLVSRNFWLDFSDLIKEKIEFKEGEYPTITPKHIAHFIRLGIKKGWCYHNSGKNFILEINNSYLTRT